MNNPICKVSINRAALGGEGFSEFNIGKVNVLLGKNGTGKSRILKSFVQTWRNFAGATEAIYVEGGRTITVPQTVSFTDHRNGQYATFELAEQQHKIKRNQDIKLRLHDALVALDKKQDLIFRQHSNAVTEWQLGGSKGEAPRRSSPPLEKFCQDFQNVFPEITLTINEGTKNIVCKKGNHSYQGQNLSDGEKQIFCLLADFHLINSEKPLLIVDEPELNLNPSLALKFWTFVENMMPGGIFVYATHSVQFALRPEVESLIILPKAGSEPLCISNLEDMNKIELNDFLGAVPAILASTKAIVVEGTDDSLDQRVYKWLLNDKSLTVEPLGSCNNVISAVKRDGIWKSLGTPLKLAGIVDRDFKSDSRIEEIQEKGVFVLPVHEVESVFCIPKLVSLLSERLAIAPKIPTEADVRNVLKELWRENYAFVAFHRALNELEIHLAPSLERKIIDGFAGDRTKLRGGFVKACNDEIERISNQYVEAELVKKIDAEFDNCERILKAGDVNEILMKLPGKYAVGKVLELTGCKNSSDLVRGVLKHIKPSEIDELVKFEASLNSFFN